MYPMASVCQFYSKGVHRIGLASTNKHEEEVIRNHEFELGIDPNIRTWCACVRKSMTTGTEVSSGIIQHIFIDSLQLNTNTITNKIRFHFFQYNKKISSKSYHWRTKRWRRKRKQKRRVAQYDIAEKEDLQRNGMPSPMGPHWRTYIEHRLRMLVNGMAVYATDGYSHLRMDKYIESNRALDTIARKLTNNKPSVVFIGASELSPSSIIRVKGNVRCPGNRKCARSFKKCGSIVRYTDEYNTSQHCGRCCRKFQPNFRPKRFKTCFNCVPDPAYDMMLPNLIVNEMANRPLKELRKNVRNWERGNQVNGPLRENRERLVSKVDIYRKNWQLNQLENLDMEAEAGADAVIGDAAAIVVAVADPMLTISKTTWHRDISAARLIWFKGNYECMNSTIKPIESVRIEQFFLCLSFQDTVRCSEKRSRQR